MMKKKTIHNMNNTKITSILERLAIENGCKFVIAENNQNSGYIETVMNNRYFFTYGTLDINTNAATEFANSKSLASSVMKEVGLSVPSEREVKYGSEKVHADYLREVCEYIEELELPIILKPVHGRQGRNIFKIEYMEELGSAIKIIIEDEDDFIVQEFIDAGEVRVVLLDGEIIQAYKRDFVNIVGDGFKTIKQLIDAKNDKFLERERNTVIDISDTQIQNIFIKNGYTSEIVLPNEYRLNLSYGRNLSKGGEYEFIEYKFNDVFRDVLKRVSKATGLRLVGFDLFIFKDVEFLKEIEDISFIEYNASPDMENNFYYDSDYQGLLHEIYKRIFDAMIGHK